MSFNTIPVNGWPQLKELQELAEKVGNIPTFTSSDKEAIEDLISNAQALISVAEDGAEGVPFDNTGTDFESTNVQGAIEEAATMGGFQYDTSPVNTGRKWIDGSDIYVKVVNFGALPDSTEKPAASGLSNVTVLSLYGISSKGTYTIPLPMTTASNIYNNVGLFYDDANNNIVITTNTDRTDYTTTYVFVEFIYNNP